MTKGVTIAASLNPVHAKRGDLLTKGTVLQASMVLVTIAILTFFAFNIWTNVTRLGMGSGFGFLSRPAGFEIAQSFIPYSAASTYFQAFCVALLNTVAVTVAAIALATILGLFVGLLRLSSNPLLSTLAASFVEVVRNVPLLLHLFFWYYMIIRPLPGPRQSLTLFDVVFLNNRGLFLPWPQMGFLPVLAAVIAIGSLLCIGFSLRHNTPRRHARQLIISVALLIVSGLVLVISNPQNWGISVPALQGLQIKGGFEIIPEFVAVVVGLGVYASAFIAEIFRGSFKGVSRGLREASQTLGLTTWQTNSRIIVPLALRSALPPLGGQYIILLKNSSLAAAIGFPDLMLIFAGTSLNQTGQPMETMFMTLAAYVTLGLFIAAGINMLNRKLAIISR